jgi:hypothetical protein
MKPAGSDEPKLAGAPGVGENFSTIFENIFQKILSDRVLSKEELEKAAPQIAKDIIDQIAAYIRRTLIHRAPRELRKARREDREFEKRNLRRWRKAFNVMEMLWHVAAETGGTFNDEERPKIGAERDFRCEALIHIHARATLVASECISLMKSGYPDGALSRWRTLHELNVIAAFLLNNPHNVALRYLLSFEFRALDAAKQMKKYAARSHIEPPSDAEIIALENRCKTHTERLGPNIGKGDYGWASEVIAKKKPNLLDLEESVGLDHWRPRFKWASQHNHGGHRPSGSLLATTESRAPVFAIGQSNSGMVDPLHMTAISLTHVTVSLLHSRPHDIGRAICAKVLFDLSNEVGKAAGEVEHGKPRT